MNEEIKNQIIRIAELHSATRLIYLLQNEEESDFEKILEEFTKFVDALEHKMKVRGIVFSDIDHTVIMKFFIVQINKGLSVDGTPMIIVNQFPDGIQLKDNPILNKEILYEDIEVRDVDYEIIKFLIK